MSTIVASELLGDRWSAAPTPPRSWAPVSGPCSSPGWCSLTGDVGGLTIGYGAAALGSLLAIHAVARGDRFGLVLGMLVLDLGNAAAQLSRYVAADLTADGSRGRAIGALVWAALLVASQVRCCWTRRWSSPNLTVTTDSRRRET
jgi:hypothetical protein